MILYHFDDYVWSSGYDTSQFYFNKQSFKFWIQQLSVTQLLWFWVCIHLNIFVLKSIGRNNAAYSFLTCSHFLSYKVCIWSLNCHEEHTLSLNIELGSRKIISSLNSVSFVTRYKWLHNRGSCVMKRLLSNLICDNDN